MMQQKTIRIINFKKKYDTISKFIFEKKILTVNELYIYELAKFCLRSFK